MFLDFIQMFDPHHHPYLSFPRSVEKFHFIPVIDQPYPFKTFFSRPFFTI